MTSSATAPRCTAGPLRTLGNEDSLPTLRRAARCAGQDTLCPECDGKFYAPGRDPVKAPLTLTVLWGVVILSAFGLIVAAWASGKLAPVIGIVTSFALAAFNVSVAFVMAWWPVIVCVLLAIIAIRTGRPRRR